MAEAGSTITDTVEELRTQLDQVTEERKAAAERARYLRFAIRNLEAAQARDSAPTPTEGPPTDGEEVAATAADWR